MLMFRWELPPPSSRFYKPETPQTLNVKAAGLKRDIIIICVINILKNSKIYSDFIPERPECDTGFNTQQFYVLPTQCIYLFCVDLRTKSHLFPIQH